MYVFVFCVLIAICQREHMIFIFWGLVYITKNTNIVRMDDILVKFIELLLSSFFSDIGNQVKSWILNYLIAVTHVN